MNYQQARQIAISICEKLQPDTSKINIAGSVRRGKPEVKDIEIICLPNKISTDLFGGGTFTTCNGFAISVMELGRVIKGKPDGRYMQIALPEGVNLDLFMPEDYDYYRQYAIRTGSADYSAKVIAGAWKAKGWCGTSEGLRLMAQCNRKDLPEGKTLWTPTANATRPPVWESEEEFFAWLGIPYLKPSQRL